MIRVVTDDPEDMAAAMVIVLKYARTHIDAPFTVGPFVKDQIMHAGMEISGTPNVTGPLIKLLKNSDLSLTITDEG